MRRMIVAVGLMVLATLAMAGTETMTGSLQARQKVSHVYTDDLGIETTEYLVSNVIWQVATGTSALQMETVWSARVALTNLATKSYDLAGGLTNRFGETISLTAVKWVSLGCDSVNRGSIKLGDGLATWSSFTGGTNQSITLRPAVQIMLMASGTNNYTVTATTGDILKFTDLNNSTNAWTNTVVISIGGTVN